MRKDIIIFMVKLSTDVPTSYCLAWNVTSGLVMLHLMVRLAWVLS